MSVLLDSNILLRRAQPSHPAHTIAVRSVATLLERNIPAYFTPQNIMEFWNVATRPADKNGLGLPQEIVVAELATIESLLTLLPDSPAVFTVWKRLVMQYRVSGVKVHDARLAAIAQVYGVKSILTFNTDDFTRFDHLKVLHPSDI